MTINQTIQDGVFLMRISGRLDTNTSSELEAALKDAFEGGASSITMDIEKLDYISSAGLRVLLTAYKSCKKKGGRLLIQHAGEMARELFEMTGFSEFLKDG